MFHPVGSQPPSVYWRRRLFLIGSFVLLLLLVVLTFNAVRSSGDGRANAGSPVTSSSSGTSSGATTSSPRTSTPPSTSPSSGTSANRSASGSSTAAHAPLSASTPTAATCVAGNLRLRSVSGASSYRMTDSPLLQLQVTNTGPQPCVQDLADKQIELRVYNGESRIWGSHDCKILPGVTDRTLMPGSPVVVSIKWSGLTSKPGACRPSSRQRVGAGTYTLYASLAGRQAPAGQFTIS